MALEPRTAAADAEDGAELVGMRRRFSFAAVLTSPLVFWSAWPFYERFVAQAQVTRTSPR